MRDVFVHRNAGRVIAVLASVSALAPAVASAEVNGGLAAPGRPAVAAATCASNQAQRCWRGAELQITGESLQAVTAVRFLGARGKSDDRTARPAAVAENEVRVTVPSRSRSGPVEIIATTGRVRGPQVSITAPPQSASGGSVPGESVPGGSVPSDQAPSDAVFPIRGAHDYGTSVNRFGGGRGHQGQDVFARCGTPLVAAFSGTVIQSTFQSRAGNYVVVQTPEGGSYAYMHLRDPASAKRGDAVSAGERIGSVGETGRASGCHLHFEWWTSPGWYRGGHPIDPLSMLKSWDRS